MSAVVPEIPADEAFDACRLSALFNGLFLGANNTVLLPHADAMSLDWDGSNASEPIYLPADEVHQHDRIVFAHGFFTSALHEIAHWCVAGDERRKRVDYGYWYRPDGRNAEQQAEFERVEVRPQAIEWAFCIASGHSFRVSTDNLSGAPVDRDAFTHRVHDQLTHYFERGFPVRAQRFIDALCDMYRQDFRLPGLD